MKFIGLNNDLKVPWFDFLFHEKRSMFEFPQPTTLSTTALATKLPYAILSTSSKANVREQKRQIRRLLLKNYLGRKLLWIHLNLQKENHPVRKMWTLFRLIVCQKSRQNASHLL